MCSPRPTCRRDFRRVPEQSTVNRSLLGWSPRRRGIAYKHDSFDDLTSHIAIEMVRYETSHIQFIDAVEIQVLLTVPHAID